MLYIAIYFLMGGFLALVALLHKGFGRDNIYVASIGMVVLWPLMLLLGPEVLSGNGKSTYTSPEEQMDTVKEQLAAILSSADGGDLELEEVRRLTLLAKYGYRAVTLFPDQANFADILKQLWCIRLHPELYRSYKRALSQLDGQCDPQVEGRTLYSTEKPNWYIGFSNEFVRSIAKADWKVQERIVEALGKISTAPLKPVGDTIKPLTADRKGLWRYRHGTSRLVYFPDMKARTIVLISFASPANPLYGTSQNPSRFDPAARRLVRCAIDRVCVDAREGARIR